jgi:predicted restriction endonuclease
MREINQINRNQRIASALKQLYDFKCQICHIAIMIDSNKYYIEVHHLKPLGIPHNGPDIIENMIVVCPNCHVKLDYKALELDLNNLIMKEPHKIQEQFVDYQNKKIVG